ncbi:hypothetical protein SynRS9915_01835 [Synechococcus sp. RS9915]|nr:hypothetical protein SynRS9915_01835 [Synechococcus sp. RS9915]
MHFEVRAADFYENASPEQSLLLIFSAAPTVVTSQEKRLTKCRF